VYIPEDIQFQDIRHIHYHNYKILLEEELMVLELVEEMLVLELVLVCKDQLQ